MYSKYFENTKKMPLKILIGIFFIALDRFLKFLAIEGFFNGQQGIFNDFFKLNFAGNYNIAFSLPLAGWWLNVIIILLVFALIYNLLYYAEKNDYTKSYLLFLITLGAISNLFDRLKHGFVIDYFDLKYFTIFNLADVMIVGGVIALVWLIFRDKKTALR